MLLILCIIMLVINNKVNYWYLFILLNIFLIFVIRRIAYSYEENTGIKNSHDENEKSLLKILRYWYGIVVILIIFKQVYYIIYYLKPADLDPVLIKMDYYIFGVNPTQWIYQFNNPFLTEFLQIIYLYYYPMIVVFGLELYLRHRYKDFKYTIFIVFFSFYFSYLLYMLFPANGPRFHLHDFGSVTAELPGVFLTEYIRLFLNFGESIPSGVPNPQDYVQRDAMPSLHIITAFLIMYLSRKFRLKSFFFYLPFVILMAIATIYLRYHYVVDVFGGVIVSVFTIWIGKKVFESVLKGKPNRIPAA